MHFGATLRLLRIESGLGLRDLARRLGVSSAYLSRVENGLDPAPTPARLRHLARELGVPAPLLADLAQRVSPFLVDYVEQVPEAGSLFLEIAHRRLDARQLAEVHAFVEQRFPGESRAARATLPGLAELLAPDRIVLGLRCSQMDDILEVVAGRIAPRGAGAALAGALVQRERELSSAIGGGVALPCAYLSGTVEAAGLVTLSPPLRHPTPDDAPLRLVIVVVGPPESTTRRLRLAHIARLSARGLADELAELRTPAQALAKLATLESLK